MAKILIIDDDEMLCDMLARHVKYMGHEADFSSTLKEGLKEISSNTYDVVFLDVYLPDGDGLKALPEILKVHYSPEVIIMTGEGDPDGAELAIKNGAWDYIEKPPSIKKLTLPLLRALQYREKKAAGKIPVALKRDGIIGSSPQMNSCLELLAKAASSKANVLITGETGTGKELFAWAIHDNSPFTDKNFVVVDCASLPETLVQSSLFGYEKGAFTGADQSRDGLIQQADGGTLFLDEVGELSMSIQKAFLRVLQERRFRPVGGKKEVESNFRLIAATNRHPDQMALSGQFRKDLLYRLQSISIELPPLRQRAQDIKELAVSQINKICEKYGTETKGFAPDFFDALYAYEWPGNVRELFNTLEGAFNDARREPILYPRHLPMHIRVKVARSAVKRSYRPQVKDLPADDVVNTPPVPSYKDFRESVLAEAEKKYFHDLMSHTKGAIKEACEVSGLGRTRLYTLMKKNGVSRFGWSSSE